MKKTFVDTVKMIAGFTGYFFPELIAEVYTNQGVKAQKRISLDLFLRMTHLFIYNFLHQKLP